MNVEGVHGVPEASCVAKILGRLHYISAAQLLVQDARCSRRNRCNVNYDLRGQSLYRPVQPTRRGRKSTGVAFQAHLFVEHFIEKGIEPLLELNVVFIWYKHVANAIQALIKKGVLFVSGQKRKPYHCSRE